MKEMKEGICWTLFALMVILIGGTYAAKFYKYNHEAVAKEFQAYYDQL